MSKIVLDEWIDEPGNAEKYRKWLQDPVTQAILDGLEHEFKPKLMPIDHIKGEVALNLLGQNVGEARVINRIQSLDVRKRMPEEIQARYNMEASLVDMGYTEADIDRMNQKYGE